MQQEYETSRGLQSHQAFSCFDGLSRNQQVKRLPTGARQLVPCPRCTPRPGAGPGFAGVGWNSLCWALSLLSPEGSLLGSSAPVQSSCPCPSASSSTPGRPDDPCRGCRGGGLSAELPGCHSRHSGTAPPRGGGWPRLRSHHSGDVHRAARRGGASGSRQEGAFVPRGRGGGLKRQTSSPSL